MKGCFQGRFELFFLFSQIVYVSAILGIVISTTRYNRRTGFLNSIESVGPPTFIAFECFAVRSPENSYGLPISVLTFDICLFTFGILRLIFDI